MRVIDPRQGFDPSLDRTGVDEQQRSTIVDGRGPADLRGTRTVGSGHRDLVDIEQRGEHGTGREARDGEHPHDGHQPMQPQAALLAGDRDASGPDPRIDRHAGPTRGGARCRGA